MYNSWNSPFYNMHPFGWPWGPQRMAEGPAASPINSAGTTKQKRSVASAPFPKNKERTSEKFHYPALPNEYWTTHKKPEVPLVDIDNTKLDHIYTNKKVYN